jgi:hypothetical protein
MLLARPPRRLAAVLPAIALALAAGACTDRHHPLAPAPDPVPAPGALGAPLTLQAFECTADRRTLSVQCAPAAPPDGAARGDIIVGIPNIALGASDVRYDAVLQRYTFDATVRNQIGQPLGTTDGATLAPNGVRVFFHAGPTAASGTGTVTVIADGVATFTGAAQPYYQYNEVLGPFELSPVKRWRFDMPPTVNSFTFVAMISAPVRFPNGWIDITPPAFSIPALDVRNFGIVVRDRFGRSDTTVTLTVSTSDPSAAVAGPVTYFSGMGSFIAPVFGARAGTVTVTASATTSSGETIAPGTANADVGGTRRLWRGTVSTDYNDPANWRAVTAGVPPSFVSSSSLEGVPTSLDTAVVNGDSATQMPVMAQNNTVGGVIMQPGALVPSINLSSFDYSLTSSIDHGSTGLILGTGRMIFAGSGTISGGVSNVDYRNARFTGSYSLSEGTNLNVTGGRLVVQGGSLQNTWNRVRVWP